MAYRRVLAAFIAAALLPTVSAHAVTVSNRDDKDVTISVIDGEGKQDHTLKRGDVLKGICEKGCVIRLNGAENDEYELEGTEVVSIEEGFLYYDGPDGSAESGSEGSGEPSSPKSK